MNNKIKTLLITTILSIGLGQNTYADRTYMCKVCPAGTFANDNKCEDCPAGSYCVNGIKKECPEHYFSTSKSSKCNMCESIYARFEYHCMNCDDVVKFLGSRLNSYEKLFCERYIARVDASTQHKLFHGDYTGVALARSEFLYIHESKRNAYQPTKQAETPDSASYYFYCYKNVSGYGSRILRLNNKAVIQDINNSLYDVEIVSCDKTSGKRTIKIFFDNIPQKRQDNSYCKYLMDTVKEQNPAGFKVISNEVVSRVKSIAMGSQTNIYEEVCAVTLQEE